VKSASDYHLAKAMISPVSGPWQAPRRGRPTITTLAARQS
jgi:hypothetical protein